MSTDSINNRLLWGGTWAFVGKVGAAVAMLAVSMLLARLLTPEEMGAWFLIFSIVQIAAMAAQFGLYQVVVRLVAEGEGTGQQGRARKGVELTFRYGTVGTVAVAGAMASGGGVWLAMNLFESPVMAGVMGLASLWVVVMVFQSLLAATFRGFYDIRLAAIFGGLFTWVLSTVLFAVLWLLKGHSDLSQVVTLSIVAGTVNAVLAGILLQGRVRTLDGPGTVETREILDLCWPIWLTSFTFLAVTQADLWILGMFRSREEVAAYGVVAKMASFVAMPLLVVNAVVAPLIAELNAAGRKQQLERMLRRTTMVAVLLAGTVIMALILGRGNILGVLFGSYYRDAWPILMVLAGAHFIRVCSGACGQTLTMTGHQRWLLVVTVTGGMLSVLLGLALVNDYGGMGVAVAVAVGFFVQNGATVILVRRKVGVWTHVSLRELFRLRQNWEYPSQPEGAAPARTVSAARDDEKTPVVPALPTVIASSVIRSTRKGDSHGGVYIVDLEKGITDQVIDWDRMDISWEGRGLDRGLRGIAVYDDKVFLAASNQIFVYDKSFKLIGSFRNRYLSQCHEIMLDGNLLYLTSTGFDSVLEFNIDTGKFTRGYCLRHSDFQKFVEKGFRAVFQKSGTSFPVPQFKPFDPNKDNGPHGGDTLHINNVHVENGEIFFSGVGLGRILRVSDAGIGVFARVPYGTHNARPYRGGVLFNHTRSDQVVLADRNGTVRERYDIKQYEPGQLLMGDTPKDHARQAFGRGLCVQDGLIIAGSSPATISAYTPGLAHPVRSVNLTMDVRNAIHGLEIWPF